MAQNSTTSDERNTTESGLNDEDTDTQLVCPDCGNGEFSFTVSQVWSGPAVEYISGNRDVEAHNDGPVVDADADPVTCVGCHSDIQISDLVPQAEYTSSTEGEAHAN